MSRISVIVLGADHGRGADSGDIVAERAGHWLRRTLQDLAPWREAGHEVVVVTADQNADNPSRHWYQRLADQCFVAAGGYATRMNAGAAAANGEILLFLRVDSRLPVNALAAILQGMGQSGCNWGRFDIQFSGRRDALRWVERLANHHSRWTGMAVSEQALFVRRELFRQVGGFAELPVLEDIDLCRRLKREGAPLCLHERVLVDSEPLERGGLGTNVKRLVAMRLAYFLGESPMDLYLRYYGTPAQDTPATTPETPEYQYPAARVLLWAQAPVLGEVKPHLQSQLGRSRALELYKQVTRFVWSKIHQRHLAPAAVWVSEPGCEEFFDELCPREQQFLQQGSDSGAALRHAVEQALQGAESVIIVTADFASLDAAHLQWALRALDDGARVVIAPTDDGSCGLLGVRKPLVENFFADIEWENDKAVSQMQERLRTAEVQWVELPTRWRLETADDLKRLSSLHDWHRESA